MQQIVKKKINFKKAMQLTIAIQVIFLGLLPQKTTFHKPLF